MQWEKYSSIQIHGPVKHHISVKCSNSFLHVANEKALVFSLQSNLSPPKIGPLFKFFHLKNQNAFSPFLRSGRSMSNVHSVFDWYVFWLKSLIYSNIYCFIIHRNSSRRVLISQFECTYFCSLPVRPKTKRHRPRRYPVVCRIRLLINGNDLFLYQYWFCVCMH